VGAGVVARISEPEKLHLEVVLLNAGINVEPGAWVKWAMTPVLTCADTARAAEKKIIQDLFKNIQDLFAISISYPLFKRYLSGT
jgi:hypothetical protein